MTENMIEGLNSLKLIQSKLDTESHLEVISEGARCWKAFFAFEPSAKKEELEPIQARWSLPRTYEQFLRYTNGALLYYDDVYGQWGFQFYGTKELLTKNALWQSLYSGWSTSYLAFAESRGDADLLLLDTSRPSNIASECYVIDGDTGYPAHTWQPIGQSFGKWLARLVVAQGAKYWRWY
jgi:hypothetical protein